MTVLPEDNSHSGFDRHHGKVRGNHEIVQYSQAGSDYSGLISLLVLNKENSWLAPGIHPQSLKQSFPGGILLDGCQTPQSLLAPKEGQRERLGGGDARVVRRDKGLQPHLPPPAGVAAAVRAPPEAASARLVHLVWVICEEHSDALTCATAPTVQSMDIEMRQLYWIYCTHVHGHSSYLCRPMPTASYCQILYDRT